MQIDWNQVPSPITFDCSKYTDYVEISHWMKQNGVRKYNYAWLCFNQLHYIGMSADNALRYGDRVTREAGHFPGWVNRLKPTTSGKDIFDSAVSMYPLINKDNLILKVWNFTHYPFRVADKPELDLEVAEDELIEAHRKTYETMPAWNKKDMGYAKKKAVVTDNMFDKFITFVV